MAFARFGARAAGQPHPPPASGRGVFAARAFRLSLRHRAGQRGRDRRRLNHRRSNARSRPRGWRLAGGLPRLEIAERARLGLGQEQQTAGSPRRVVARPEPRTAWLEKDGRRETAAEARPVRPPSLSDFSRADLLPREMRRTAGALTGTSCRTARRRRRETPSSSTSCATDPPLARGPNGTEDEPHHQRWWSSSSWGWARLRKGLALTVLSGHGARFARSCLCVRACVCAFYLARAARSISTPRDDRRACCTGRCNRRRTCY